MLKLTLTLVTLAALHGAFASPIPAGNTINALTNAVAGVAGSLSGVGRRQDIAGLAGLDNLLGGLSGRQDDEDLLDNGDDQLLRKREAGLPVVGSAVSGLPAVGNAGAIANNIPVVGSLVGGAPLKKRQLGEVGSLIGGAGAIGDIGGVAGLLKRQDGDADLPVIGSLVGGAPLKRRQLGEVGSLIGGAGAIGDIGGVAGLLKRQNGDVDTFSPLQGLGGLEGDDLTPAEDIVARRN